MVFLGKTSWMSQRTCLIVSLFPCELVRVVLDVSDVSVSLTFVVTEFCDVSSMCYDREFVEPQSFSVSKKTRTLLHRYAGRDEVRRITSESAPAFKKKDDTDAKFVQLL